MKTKKPTLLTLNEVKASYNPSYCPKIKVTNIETGVNAARTIYQILEAEIELREYFILMFLNRSNIISSYYLLSIGGINGTIADIRLAFGIALKCLANAIIIIHNHPSGNLQPSDADLKLTNKFKEAGILLEIPILDHIILTKESYFSFEEHGLL